MWLFLTGHLQTRKNQQSSWLLYNKCVDAQVITSGQDSVILDLLLQLQDGTGKINLRSEIMPVLTELILSVIPVLIPLPFSYCQTLNPRCRITMWRSTTQ